jgi:predicted metal-binding membrane protein
LPLALRPSAHGEPTLRALRSGRRWSSLGLEVRHGAFCLGCCWAHMLVMVGIGVGSLGCMAALAAVIGIARVLLAVLWLAQPAWMSLGAGV